MKPYTLVRNQLHKIESWWAAPHLDKVHHVGQQVPGIIVQLGVKEPLHDPQTVPVVDLQRAHSVSTAVYQKSELTSLYRPPGTTMVLFRGIKLDSQSSGPEHTAVWLVSLALGISPPYSKA